MVSVVALSADPLTCPEDFFADPSRRRTLAPGKIRDRRFAGEAARLGALARILEMRCLSKPGSSGDSHYALGDMSQCEKRGDTDRRLPS